MEKVNAIVLKSVEYKENDRIITLFSLEEGKFTANIRGVKKAGAKLKFAAQPFCFAEYVLAEKSGRYTVTQAALHESFFDLSSDMEKYYAAATILEFINAFMPEGMPSEELFLASVGALKTLAYFIVKPRLVLIRFLLTALSISGYAVDTAACGACGKDIENKVFLDAAEGRCVCEECKKDGDVEFNIKTYKLLKAVANREYTELSLVDSDVLTAKKGLKFLSYYLLMNADVALPTLDALIKSDF